MRQALPTHEDVEERPGVDTRSSGGVRAALSDEPQSLGELSAGAIQQQPCGLEVATMQQQDRGLDAAMGAAERIAGRVTAAIRQTHQHVLASSQQLLVGGL